MDMLPQKQKQTHITKYHIILVDKRIPYIDMFGLQHEYGRPEPRFFHSSAELNSACGKRPLRPKPVARPSGQSKRPPGIAGRALLFLGEPLYSTKSSLSRYLTASMAAIRPELTA